MAKELILGVHCLLPKKFSSKISALKKKCDFLAPSPFDPHITLYLSKFPKNNFEKAVVGVRERNERKFFLRARRIKVENSGIKGFCFLDLRKSSPLMKIHKEVVFSLNRLRNKQIRSKDVKRIKLGKYSKAEIRNIQKYGYARVLKFFQPHITLGEVSIQNDKLEKHFKPLFGQKFEIKQLVVGLYEYDTVKDKYTRNYIEQEIPLI